MIFPKLVLLRDFMQFVQRFIFYSFHSVLLGSQVRTRRAWRSIPLGCKHLLIHIQGGFACLGGVFNNSLHLDFSSDLRRFWQPFSDGLKPTTTPREDFHIPSRKNTQNLKMLNYHRVDIGSVIVVLTWLQDSLFDCGNPETQAGNHGGIHGYRWRRPGPRHDAWNAGNGSNAWHAGNGSEPMGSTWCPLTWDFGAMKNWMTEKWKIRTVWGQWVWT